MPLYSSEYGLLSLIDEDQGVIHTLFHAVEEIILGTDISSEKVAVRLKSSVVLMEVIIALQWKVDNPILRPYPTLLPYVTMPPFTNDPEYGRTAKNFMTSLATGIIAVHAISQRSI